MAVLSRSNNALVDGKKEGANWFEYVYRLAGRQGYWEKGDLDELMAYINKSEMKFLRALQEHNAKKAAEKKAASKKTPKVGYPPRHPPRKDGKIEEGVASTGTRRKVFGRGSTRRRRHK